MSDIKPRARYPGIRPFDTEEGDLFFGRQTEISSLLRLIRLQQTTLLYSRSGLGKSSLLRAGIARELLQTGEMEPHLIRFTAYQKDVAGFNSPVEEILKSELAKQPTGHPFSRILPEKDTLWTRFKKQQAMPGSKPQLLIFDQFEELFTYPEAQIHEFKMQLAELLFTKVPQEYRDLISRDEVADQMPEADLDLFLTPPDVRVVFSIRFDRMGMLQRLTDQFPRILNNFFELRPMSREAALQAIVEPAKAEGVFVSQPFSYAEKALTSLLNDLEGDSPGIEPAQIQIVCAHLEERVMEKSLTVISESDIGDINAIFNRYYETQLLKIPRANRLKVRKLIEDELIVGRVRVTLPRLTLLNKGLSGNLIDLLVNSRLLRSEITSTGQAYEITHDSMVAPILVSRSARLKKRNNTRFLIFMSSFTFALMALLIINDELEKKRYRSLIDSAHEAAEDSNWSAAADKIKLAMDYGKDKGLAKDLWIYQYKAKRKRASDSIVEVADSLFFSGAQEYEKALACYRKADSIYTVSRYVRQKKEKVKSLLYEEYILKATAFVQAASYEDARFWVRKTVDLNMSDTDDIKALCEKIPPPCHD